MIPELIHFAQAHKGAETMGSMWLARELVNIFPYVRANGGVVGILKHFFVGSPRGLPAENHNPS